MTAYSPVLGEQRPRISSIPPYKSTAGPEAIELAAMAGLYLDDWQQWHLTNALGVKDDGQWSAFEVGLIVARQNGKNIILEARELAGLFLFDEELIIHTAHEFKTCEESFRRLCYWIENTPEFDRRVKRIRTAAGEQGIELLNGQRIRFLARSRTSGRGFSGDVLIWDEAMILDAAMVGSTLPILAARPNPQVWYTASAGLPKSTQLASVRRRGMDKVNPSRNLFFAEWSIKPHHEYCEPQCKEHDDPTTLESVAKANPALGIHIGADYIGREREAMSITPGEFDREHLSIGEYPALDEGWLVIPQEWWDATQDDDEDPPLLRFPVFAVDVNRERSQSSIGVCGMRPDGRVGIELIECRGGTKWIIELAVHLQEKHRPIRWIVDPRASAGSLIDDMIDKGFRVEKVGPREITHACGQFFDGIRDDWLWHKFDKRLRAAVAGVIDRPLSEAWAWDRKNSAVDISSLMAVTLALWGFMKYGKPGDHPVGKTVHFNVKEIIRLVKAGVYGPSDVARIKDRGLLDDDDIEKLRENGIYV